MKSTITSLGHSGLDIRLGSARIVCDPWLSPRGAYLASWHQFPRNDHLVASDLHDTPNLFISSPRPDHFDVETLRGFPKILRVILPKLASTGARPSRCERSGSATCWSSATASRSTSEMARGSSCWPRGPSTSSAPRWWSNARER